MKNALALSLAMAVIFAVACGGGSSSKTSFNSAPAPAPAPPAVVQPPTVQSTSFTVDVLGTSDSSASGSVSAKDPQGLPLTYSITQPPTVGTVSSLNTSTGAFVYKIQGYTASTADSFVVNVSNGTASATATISAKMGIDPLLPNQWHLQNTGQNAFSSTYPSAGNDMNVAGAWAAGISGKGIKVAVVDSGLEAAHEDLTANVDVGNSFNFLTGSNDPTRAATDVDFDHGTSVAGIIGAVAFNGKGGRGVAYNAHLRGYNFLVSHDVQTLANETKALGSDPISADNDVFNASWGSEPQIDSGQKPILPPVSPTRDAILQNLLGLRNGLGAALVKSAGNQFQDYRGDSSGYCGSAKQYSVSCDDPAIDRLNSGIVVPILVAAINANGVHASYSDSGSALWISAPGGEYGFDQTFIGTGHDSTSYQPAIIATARSGCANAEYPPTKFPNGVNGLDSNGSNPLAPNCQYTAVMNGTSSAAPNVTGVVALMLEANPKLSVRDIKDILMKTAKQVDPQFAGVSSGNIVLEQGWVTNKAGWRFSTRYGFGAVDASAAVAMAKSYGSFLPPLQTSKSYQSAVPPTGLSITFPVSESFSAVEQVAVRLNVDSIPGLWCNQVELTSPSGTKSILLHAANGFQNPSLVDTRLLSNAFYGESVNGTWKLTFYNFCPASYGPTQLSTTMPQSLQIYGH